MALYRTLSNDELVNMGLMPSTDQTQMYNMLGRNDGNAGGDNFFTRRGKSIENAIGTTLALPASIIDTANENRSIDERLNRFGQSIDDIYKNAGYNNADEYQQAKDSTERDLFNKYGLNYDDYYNKRAELSLNDPLGNSEEVKALDRDFEAQKQNARNIMSADDASTFDRFNDIENQLKTQSAANYNEADQAAQNWKNYRDNSYVGQKINQDPGKFAGSAINTLSTAFDVMAPAAGVLANSVQGGIEGIADELEQNGLQNFNWDRAQENAMIGATTGAVTGGLNKALTSKLAKNGGNLFKGGNVVTRGLNNLGSQTALGRVGSTLATGAGRGALSGAVGGATGAGLSAAMNGQDVLGSALKGATQGAQQGALAGGVMAGAGMAANGIKNRIDDLGADPDNGFGLRYNKFAGDGDKAIEYLLKRGGGEVEGAVKSPAVENITGDGNVDFVYGKTGDNGYGLAHIVEKHGEGVVKKIPSILENGKVVDDPRYTNSNRITLVSDDNTGAVRLGWDGNKKQWVVTAYEGLPYSSAPSVTNQIADNAVLRGSSVQEPSGATVDSIIPQNKQNVNNANEEPFMAYGESGLATGQTKKQNLRSKMGRTMQAAQANATRKETRDIGISDAGELINKVRKRTGLTDLADQAAFAKELTGGENSLLDAIQRNAIAATEDGSARTVDLSPLEPKISKLIDDTPNTLIPPTKKEEIRNAVFADLRNSGIDTIKKANNFKSASKQQFAINERTPNDSAKELGILYAEIGNLVDEASYSQIPLSQVEAMFDTGVDEARARAQVAANNGNKKYETAYKKLADELETSPRTIEAFRSSKKDFVDVDKLDKKTKQGATAWNNSPLTMGTALTAAMATGNPFAAVPAAWAAKTFAPAIGQAAIDASAKLGGKIADWGDNAASKTTKPVNTNVTTQNNVVKNTYNPATRVFDAIGRTEGLTNAEQAKTANYLVDATQEANNEQSNNMMATPVNNTGTLESLANTTTPSNSNGVYNSVYGSNVGQNQSSGSQPTAKSGNSYFKKTGDYWTDILGRAMTIAIDSEDYNAFGQLYDMYQNQLSKLEKNSNSNQKLTATQQRANAAMNSLERLSNMTPDLGYNLSGIPVIGNIATLGGNDYEGEAKSLAQQIGYMVSGANIKEEEAYNIGKAYVPQPFDSEQTRKLKLQRAYDIITQYQNGVAEA